MLRKYGPLCRLRPIGTKNNRHIEHKNRNFLLLRYLMIYRKIKPLILAIILVTSLRRTPCLHKTISALLIASLSACAQIGNVQIPSNETVLGKGPTGELIVERTSFNQALIDLYAGKEAHWPAGRVPRIVLQPSPGQEKVIQGLIANAPVKEVLISRPSGGYFALTTQVPVTRFFKVLGRADCNDVLWSQFTNTQLISRFSQSYLGVSQARGSSHALNCLAALEMHWEEAGGDKSGADGAILDPTTVQVLDSAREPFLGVAGLQRVRAKAWGIAFSEPDQSDIDALTNTPIYTLQSIDQIRLQALFYWAENHQKRELGPRFLSLLPNLKKQSWTPVEIAAFSTVSRLSPEALTDEMLFAVLESGVNGEIDTKRRGYIDPIPHQSAQLVPETAASILACRPNKSEIKGRLEYVARNARFYNHRNAAILALLAMHETSVVDEMRIQTNTKVSQDAKFLVELSEAKPIICKNG